jgi:large subunit ribosomal protein L30
MAQLKITYTKSTIGYAESQKATVRSLGLRKLHQSVIHEDTPVIRGMIFKVKHLVTVEELNDASATQSSRVYNTPTGGER